MTLPFPPREAYLLSMWLMSNLVAALVLGIIAAVLAGPVWFVLTAGMFLGVAVLGRRWNTIQLKVYQMWNQAAGRVRKTGFRWILFLSHGLLLRAIGPEGSKFEAGINRSASTGWTSYSTEFRSGSSARQTGPIDEIAWKGLTQHYIAWAREDGNRWALLLLPFLVSISLFSPREENATTPSNIYTLF